MSRLYDQGREPVVLTHLQAAAMLRILRTHRTTDPHEQTIVAELHDLLMAAGIR